MSLTARQASDMLGVSLSAVYALAAGRQRL